MACPDTINGLVAEILAPGSKANINERDAAVEVRKLHDKQRMGPHFAEQLQAYYRRVHLGEMGQHLTARGA